MKTQQNLLEQLATLEMYKDSYTPEEIQIITEEIQKEFNLKFDIMKAENELTSEPNQNEKRIKELLEQSTKVNPDSSEMFHIVRELEVIQAEIVKENCRKIQDGFNL